MVRIDSYQWGKVVAGGKTYTSDVVVFPHGVESDWRRKRGHEVSPEDIEGIVEEKEDFDVKPEFRSKENFTDIQLILKKNSEVIEKSMNLVSNIQIPKIHIPKIRVHVPKVNIYRKEEDG